jgi:antirestriction protein ArdC
VVSHELGHWVCSKRRLNINVPGRFGSAAYAAEEMRVDFAASMVCANLGITTDVSNAAAYLASWAEVLKNDKREIFRAAADAQRIADFILKFHPDFAVAAEASAQVEADDKGTNAPEVTLEGA